jgi:ParB family chromosome partitioning protein
MARRNKLDPEQFRESTDPVTVRPDGSVVPFEGREDQAQDQAAERAHVQQAPQVVLLDPYEIQAPVELNTRRFQTTRESIVGLAMSMLEDGQQVPVKVAKLPDGTHHLVFGYRRWQAAVLINEEKLSEAAFRLQAIVVPYVVGDEACSTGAGLVSGVVENTQRVGLGPLDEAYAIQRMKEAGMSQAVISRKMGVSQSTVTQRLKLLELPVMAQKRVNRGEMPLELALTALDIPKGEERSEALKSLTERVVTSGRGGRLAEGAEEGETVEGDSGQVVKLVRSKTAKKMLAELEEYATPDGDGERTKAQVWLLTKLIPWVRNPKRKFQRVMEALEGLG